MAQETTSSLWPLETAHVSAALISAAAATVRQEWPADRALELMATAAPADTDPPNPPDSHETRAEIALTNGVYQNIRRQLQARFGIPSEEIAFIHEADTPAKKAALFEAVNAGRVRVLLGSTGKLGTGVNVQKRLIALHHLDTPWKPAELEQREGRILRQGNIYPEVLVFHYVTERSFDGYMLQTLEAKARFIAQIMAGEVTARTAEEVGEMVLTVAQVKAIASGHPLVQRRIETEVKLVKLDRLRAAFYQQRAALQTELAELPHHLATQTAIIMGHERALQARAPVADDAFAMTLWPPSVPTECTVYRHRERAGGQLRQWADALLEQLRRGAGGGPLTVEVGHYRGLRVALHVVGQGAWAERSSLFDCRAEVQLYAEPDGVRYVAQIGESNLGVTQSIDYQVRHIETRLAQAQAQATRLQERLAQAQTEAQQPWAHAAEYTRLRRLYEALGQSLQTEGVALENNLEFAAEPVQAETTDAIESSATAWDDTAELARNPLTGLETEPLLAPEPAPEEAITPTPAPPEPAQWDFLPRAEAVPMPMVVPDDAPPAAPLTAQITPLPAPQLFLWAQADISAPTETPLAGPSRRRTTTARPRPAPQADPQGRFTWGA